MKKHTLYRPKIQLACTISKCAVLPSTPLAGMGLSITAVPMIFLTGSSSNNPHTTELQTNSNSITYLPPSKRLIRSDTLLDFSFATLETGVGISSSILGFWFDKALCLGVWYVTGDTFCRWIGFGGTANNNNNNNQSLMNYSFELPVHIWGFCLRTYYSNEEETILASLNLKVALWIQGLHTAFYALSGIRQAPCYISWIKAKPRATWTS